MTDPYLPDGCTQEDCDRAAGDPCEARCEGCKQNPCECCQNCGAKPDEACEPYCGLPLDESEECPHGVLYCEPCTACFPPRWENS